MTDVNKLLSVHLVQQKFEKLYLPENVEFPIFPNEVLWYGSLSDPTHLTTNLRTISISNKADQAYKQFFGFIVSKYKLQEEYSEEEAASAAVKHKL